MLDKMRMDDEHKILLSKRRHQLSDDRKKVDTINMNNNTEYLQEVKQASSLPHERTNHLDGDRRDERDGKKELIHLESSHNSKRNSQQYGGIQGGESSRKNSIDDQQLSSIITASSQIPSSLSPSNRVVVRPLPKPTVKQCRLLASSSDHETADVPPSSPAPAPAPSPGKKSVKIVPPKPPKPMSPDHVINAVHLHSDKSPLSTLPATKMSIATSPSKPSYLLKSPKSPQTPISARGPWLNPFSHNNATASPHLTVGQNKKSPLKPLKPPKPSPIASGLMKSVGLAAGGGGEGEGAAALAVPPPPPPPPSTLTSSSLVHLKTSQDLFLKTTSSTSASTEDILPLHMHLHLPLPLPAEITASQLSASVMLHSLSTIENGPSGLTDYQDYRCDSLDEDKEGNGAVEEGGGGGGGGVVSSKDAVLRDGTANIDNKRIGSFALSDLEGVPSPPFECSEFDSEDEQNSFLGTDDVSCSYPDLEREFQDESFFPYRMSGTYE